MTSVFHISLCDATKGTNAIDHWHLSQVRASRYPERRGMATLNFFPSILLRLKYHQSLFYQGAKKKSELSQEAASQRAREQIVPLSCYFFK